MSAFVIAYDKTKLEMPPEEFNSLVEEVASESLRFSDDFWVIVSDQSATNLMNRLKTKLSHRDSVLIMQMAGKWAATQGLGDEHTDWLFRNMFR